jgi:carbon starvation protein CstA
MTVYQVQKDKPFIITLLPALFMTTVCSTFLFVSKQAFGLNETLAYTLGGVALVVALVWFFAWNRKFQNTHQR